MTITINGTTGISGVDGSAGTPALQGGDTNTGVFFPAADTVAIATGGVERVRTDSSGNVGIGMSSPAARLHVSDGSTGLDNGTIRLGSNPTYYSQIQHIYNNNELRFAVVGGGQFQTFYTNGSERARIDSSGNLLVGSTTTGYTSSRLVLSLDDSTRWVTGPGAGIATRFYVSASNSGGVYLNGTSATSWTAISDERFKTDFLPIENAAEKVSSLRAVTGVLKSDENKTRRPFLIAQDVLAVLPEAVDTTDENQLGLAYTDIIPLLVAAIQELNAKVEAQAAEIAALKGQA